MNSAQFSADLRRSYADYYRSTYAFEQEHRSAGRLNLFRSPRHAAGNYMESSYGISLQISRRPRLGTSRIDLGAGRFEAKLSTPNYVIAPPNHSCTYELSADIDLLVVEFPSEMFQDCASCSRDLGPLHFGAHSDMLPIHFAERLWELSTQPLARLETDSLGIAFATLLVRAHKPRFEDGSRRGGLKPRELRLLIDYIHSHIADDLSLANLAGLVDLSPYHFARAFKASMGVPPHRYQMMLRIERAKELLASTDFSITEIAHTCGFASSQHMATVFRYSVSTTPTEYRRQSRL
ncbi:helix-turn-helix domain-containing protein [Microvirga sp. G4-2]|uniref:helix-turn-helix domain-containing protein n=1 Tax=Microvirga sp. G4-2 TaxID=3434467 RepID=UPI00404498D1